MNEIYEKASELYKNRMTLEEIKIFLNITECNKTVRKRIKNILGSEYDASKARNIKIKNEKKIKSPIIDRDCPYCSTMFKTVNIYYKHLVKCDKRTHPLYKGTSWNKGLTTKNSPKVKDYVDRAKRTRKDNLESGKTVSTKHTQESKDKISKARIAYLQANPSQVPYLLNHSSKESYPEKYFREIFEKENLVFEPQYPVGSYNLDFAFIDQKIDFEVDGDQHYLDPKVVKSDIRRNKYLEDLGWKVIRLKWSDFKKLTLDKKQEIVYDLLSKLDRSASNEGVPCRRSGS